MEVSTFVNFKEEVSTRSFSSLPEEMLRHCFEFLSAKELCRIHLVCIKWQGVCEGMQYYWKDLLKHYIPRGLRLSSSDSFLQTTELSWKNKYRMLTTTSNKDVKFVLVGDCKVGKTKLIHRYLNFKSSNYIPTIHDTYSTRVFSGEGIHNISVWDTSGDEDYDRLRPLSYMKSDVACIVFSYDDHQSFTHISTKWYPEIRHFIPDAAIVLIGIKNSCVEDPEKRIDPSQLKNLLKMKGVTCYVECEQPESETCFNIVLEEGLKENLRRAAKKKQRFFNFFKRKKESIGGTPAVVKHLHYGVHNSHVGRNLDTGYEEMWMLTQAPNRVTTVLYVSY